MNGVKKIHHVGTAGMNRRMLWDGLGVVFQTRREYINALSRFSVNPKRA